MMNLIIKDILIQKKMLVYSLLYTIFAALTLSSMGPSGLALYVLSPTVTTYLFITTAVTYDDKNKSQIVLISLPIKRDDIVFSKYISTFVFGAFGIIYSILIGFIGKIIGLPMFTRSISLLDIVLVLSFICIFSSIFFPVYFKFGDAKMKIFTFIIFMAIFFVPSLAFDYITSNPDNILVHKLNYFINNTSSLTQNSLALMVGLIFLLISLMISIRIYNNKEF
ncbi:ABC-2 transporter permease [Clostridium lacusfryxellense]|uniref:ABC-2 transporter permease n=1 Tax=Clostridium lacusfryxellense TaxID=205328 RepID=UPI001C0B5ACB|nr:ABC-2 transporter permease [Clostridium lacusfryxellense]MBU3111199.1 ABC-2 transporter permease [Clostridium lacusfryxellense]